MLRLAMDGIGCNTELVNEMFATLTTSQINDMRVAYEMKSDRPLGDRLRSELSGEHESVVLRLLMNGRSDAPANEAKARETANLLSTTIREGKSMMGGLSSSAESKIGQIITDNSWMQCQAIKVGSAGCLCSCVSC